MQLDARPRLSIGSSDGAAAIVDDRTNANKRPCRLYRSGNGSGDPREQVVFANLKAALASTAAVEELDCADLRATWSISPGSALTRAREPIVAFGKEAAIALAASAKTIVFAKSFDDLAADELEAFIWSCMTSQKIIALGTTANQSAFRLPIPGISSQSTPPLKLQDATQRNASTSVLLIEHAPTEICCEELSRKLEDRGAIVERFAAASWRSRPSEFHIHLGQHTLQSEAIRLVDSWRSGSSVIQFQPHWRLAGHDVTLAIDPERNGLVGRTLGAICECFDELQADPALKNKLRFSGSKTVEPLVRDWWTIAEECLS